MSDSPGRKTRIATGLAGFLILAAGTPCILAMWDSEYVQGSGDIEGVLGVGGLSLLVLFVGVSLLYQSLRSRNTENASDTPER